VVGIATTYTTIVFSEIIVVIDIFLDGKPDGITFAETINIVPNKSKPFVFF
jgi:spore maturation protein SpmB